MESLPSTIQTMMQRMERIEQQERGAATCCDPDGVIVIDGPADEDSY